MKYLWLVLIPLIFLCLSGCGILWEPYPGWIVEDITPDTVPKRVLKAFENNYPNCTIQRIQRSTFTSRISGYPKLYRFTFALATNGKDTIIFDEKGQVSDLYFWFDDLSKANTKAKKQGSNIGNR